MADEVIGRSFIELLPRAQNFGRDVAAQIRSQMSGVAGAVERTNQQIQNSSQRVRDARGRFVKQSADEEVKQSKRAGDQVRRETSRVTAGVSRSFGQMRVGIFKSFHGLGGVVAGALAGVAVGGFIKNAITAASDLNETVSKTGVVFGQQTPEILKFAKTAAASLGQSQQQALDAASNFAIFGKSAGLQGPALTKFSTGLVGLTADMASFSNTTPQEAIDAVGAALRGEAEPIRRYGVLIDDASTRQEAMRLGIVKTTKEALTPQQRVLAVQALIMKQTAVAQGDFARTSGGLANQQRILGAQFDNFKSSIGQVALPLVTKLFQFLNTTALPAAKNIQYGIEGMVAAFQGEGVTSSGFVGFFERVGVASRVAFDYFKTTILPVLAQFGQFLIGTVVPAVGNLIAALRPVATDIGAGVVATFQKLAPVLQEIGQWIAGTVVPALVSFTGWLKQNSTVVGAVVIGVLAMITAVKAYQLAMFLAATATKAYTLATQILDKVMKLSTIGIVVTLIIGLAAALVYAYKKSETFRNIVNGVWNAIKTGAQVAFGAVSGFVKGAIDWVTVNFPKILAVITYPFTKGQELIAIAWAAIKGFVKGGVAFVVDMFLGLVEVMITGAAKAFGWVPGLGPKLKTAASDFRTFRDNTNKALLGIKDQQVNVTPHLTSVTYTVAGVTRTTPSNIIGSAGRGMFRGGAVRGPGTTTSDSIPTLLSNQEHVWSAREVIGAGGHAAVANMRAMARQGRAAALAAGGRPGLNPQGQFPSARGQRVWASEVASHAKAAAAPYAARAAANAFNALFAVSGGGPAGPPGSRRSFRGVTLNERTIRMVIAAERILGAVFHITQGSWSTRVAASGGTHAGGGAMDTNEAGRGWNTAVKALRQVGFAAWHRVPSQGPWRDHIHSIARGDPSASPSAKRQVQDFIHGGDGLGSLRTSPKATSKSTGKTRNTPSFATGAWQILADQLAVVHKDEMVIPKETAGYLRRLLPGATRGSGYLRRPKLPTKHDLHMQHLAHLAHAARFSTLSNRYGTSRSRLEALLKDRPGSDSTGGGDTGGGFGSDVQTVRLSDEDRRLLQAIADRPIELDGVKVDRAMGRRAVSGGRYIG